MKPNIEELRKKYMDHPPEGFTSEDIRNMSEDELLDMDYFLNEDDLFSDEAGVEGLGQSGNGTLGFRTQAMCLVAENLGEIAAVRI